MKAKFKSEAAEKLKNLRKKYGFTYKKLSDSMRYFNYVTGRSDISPYNPNVLCNYFCGVTMPPKYAIDKLSEPLHTKPEILRSLFLEVYQDRHSDNKEAHIEILKGYKQKLENSCSNQLDEDIKAFDNAIKALERPRSEWIKNETRPNECQCSNCGNYDLGYFPFCHWCGADMQDVRKIKEILETKNTPWHEKMDEAAWDRWNTTEKREALDNE